MTALEFDHRHLPAETVANVSHAGRSAKFATEPAEGPTPKGAPSKQGRSASEGRHEKGNSAGESQKVTGKSRSKARNGFANESLRTGVDANGRNDKAQRERDGLIIASVGRGSASLNQPIRRALGEAQHPDDVVNRDGAFDAAKIHPGLSRLEECLGLRRGHRPGVFCLVPSRA